MPIIAAIPRDERCLMQKAIHKARDKNHARRLTAIRIMHRGERVFAKVVRQIERLAPLRVLGEDIFAIVRNTKALGKSFL